MSYTRERRCIRRDTRVADKSNSLTSNARSLYANNRRRTSGGFKVQQSYAAVVCVRNNSSYYYNLTRNAPAPVL